jgi:hypothetical protein
MRATAVGYLCDRFCIDLRRVRLVVFRNGLLVVRCSVSGGPLFYNAFSAFVIVGFVIVSSSTCAVLCLSSVRCLVFILLGFSEVPFLFWIVSHPGVVGVGPLLLSLSSFLGRSVFFVSLIIGLCYRFLRVTGLPETPAVWILAILFFCCSVFCPVGFSAARPLALGFLSSVILRVWAFRLLGFSASRKPCLSVSGHLCCSCLGFCSGR